MAGILRPKAISVGRSAAASGSVLIQPPAGKVWWFKATRYAVYCGSSSNSIRLRQKAGGNEVTAKEWNASVTEAGETPAGSFASPDGLVVAWSFTPVFAFAWVGVEADVTVY